MTKEEAKKTLQDMWECLFNEMTTHTFEDLKEHGMLDNYSTAFDMAISALKGGWIPVTERLPKDGQRVVVTYMAIDLKNGGHVERISQSLFTPKYDKDGEFIFTPNVIAWREDIEPYKKGE